MPKLGGLTHPVPDPTFVFNLNQQSEIPTIPRLRRARIFSMDMALRNLMTKIIPGYATEANFNDDDDDADHDDDDDDGNKDSAEDVPKRLVFLLQSIPS